jgi:hypothetical protein
VKDEKKKKEKRKKKKKRKTNWENAGKYTRGSCPSRAHGSCFTSGPRIITADEALFTKKNQKA